MRNLLSGRHVFWAATWLKRSAEFFGRSAVLRPVFTPRAENSETLNLFSNPNTVSIISINTGIGVLRRAFGGFASLGGRLVGPRASSNHRIFIYSTIHRTPPPSIDSPHPSRPTSLAATEKTTDLLHSPPPQQAEASDVPLRHHPFGGQFAIAAKDQK